MSISCDGSGCSNVAVRGRMERGWIILTAYPLYRDDPTPQIRRHLCCRCARLMEAIFK